MIVATPYRATHLARLRTQAAQLAEIAIVTPRRAELMESTYAYSIFDADEPLLCGGVLETEGTGMLWAFVSGDAGRRMVTVSRMVDRFLTLAHLRRIETSVRAGFEEGCRWMGILGFEHEGLMRKFGADGSDHIRYARIS